MSIGTDGLVLSVHQYPQPDLVLGDRKVLSDPALEHAVGFRLQHAEAWQVGWRPVFLVKGGEIKALVASKGIIGDDLECRE
jgi:hypothetical protein